MVAAFDKAAHGTVTALAFLLCFAHLECAVRCMPPSTFALFWFRFEVAAAGTGSMEDCLVFFIAEEHKRDDLSALWASRFLFLRTNTQPVGPL